MPTYATLSRVEAEEKRRAEGDQKRVAEISIETNARTAGEAAFSQQLAAAHESIVDLAGRLAALEAPTEPTPTPEPPAPEGKVLYRQDFKSLPAAHKGDGTWYMQANPERVHPTANGAIFEIRQGDLEADTNTEMAELTLDPNFHTGEEIWVRHRFRWTEADTATPGWETVHEWHDGGSTGGNYSPAVALFRYGQTIKLVNGRGSPIYWTGPSVKRGEWCELVYRVKFDSTAGELEALWNGAPITTFKSLTNNTGLAYLKVGCYRAKGTVGLSSVEHALLAIGSTKAIVLAA